MATTIQPYLDKLAKLDFSKMYNEDFLLTWEKSTDELQALYAVADALRNLRERNISTRLFESGLAVSLFRDNSTRTRFSFASGSNLLGLQLMDLDEGKSQIAHGETVRETATMISFMADVIGIRDDKFIGKGDAYMREVSASVKQAYEDGVLDHRPTLIWITQLSLLLTSSILSMSLVALRISVVRKLLLLGLILLHMVSLYLAHSLLLLCFLVLAWMLH